MMFQRLERREALARVAFDGATPEGAPDAQASAAVADDRHTVARWVDEAANVLREIEAPKEKGTQGLRDLRLIVMSREGRASIRGDGEVIYEGAVRGEAASALTGTDVVEADFKGNESDFARIRESGSLLEALSMLVKLAPSGQRGTIAGIAGLRTVAMLGLTHAKTARSTLNMFDALMRMGVDVSHACSACGPFANATIEAKVLLPNHDRLRSLYATWASFESRLRVPFPTFGSKYFAGLALLTFSADRSVTNLSSIAMLLLGLGSADVVLTGDGLQADVGVALRQAASSTTVRTRRVHYQIPHHGGAHNTDCSGDKLPRDVLGSLNPIAIAFASGGRESVECRGRGPRQQVLDYHRAGARRVIATRRLSLRDGHFDILFD
jgi:hypothetical protein